MSEVGEGVGLGEIVLPENVSYVKKGPRFVDILVDSASLADRTNMIKTETFREKRVSEKKSLYNLGEFLNEVEATALKRGDGKEVERASLFRENLVYIGEKELEEAVRGIASHLLEEARRGVGVVVYYGHARSERYVALRVMEELDELVEDLDEEVEVGIHGWGQKDNKEIRGYLREKKDDLLMAVVDDYAISGVRTRGWVNRAIDLLFRAGYEKEEALGAIEANLVAIPVKKDSRLGEIDINGQDLTYKVRGYFGVEEYRNKKGNWAIFPGVSISGSHSSVDYGFEEPIRLWRQYLGISKEDFILPTQIERPYEVGEDRLSFADQNLQARWEKIVDKYGFINRTQ